MGKLIVDLSNNRFAAVEYVYPFDLRIYSGYNNHLELHHGIETVFGKDAILDYVSKKFDELRVLNAVISNVTFYSIEYNKTALCLPGSDWRKIQAEVVMKVEPFTFDSPEQMIEHCTISDY